MQTILVPIDIKRCPLDVFELVNGFANQADVTLVLLHVLNVNIMAPDNRVYEELRQEAAGHLARLAVRYVSERVTILIRVRFGNPAKEILAEARAQRADLILLGAGQTSVWNRLFAPISCRTVKKVLREAGRGVFLVPVRTRGNCREGKDREPLRQPRDHLDDNSTILNLRTAAVGDSSSPPH